MSQNSQKKVLQLLDKQAHVSMCPLTVTVLPPLICNLPWSLAICIPEFTEILYPVAGILVLLALYAATTDLQ